MHVATAPYLGKLCMKDEVECGFCSRGVHVTADHLRWHCREFQFALEQQGGRSDQLFEYPRNPVTFKIVLDLLGKVLGG